MAVSPSHKFGQIIGDVLEAAILPMLSAFASKHGLYLDKKGPRRARTGNKVSWKDLNGNTHDLDFVLERHGSADRLGAPVAFIEAAWRRYTKHSRNKAQEIQGAVMPLVETYARERPFKGAIIAGVFTEGALTQLRSLGFVVLFFPYDTIISAFKKVGIDAFFDESTSDGDFETKLQRWEKLTTSEKLEVSKGMIELNQGEVAKFVEALKISVSRTIKSVGIKILHGTSFEWQTIEEAITFINAYDEGKNSYPFVRYEIEIVYNNGDVIEAEFGSKKDALEFLATYGPRK